MLLSAARLKFLEESVVKQLQLPLQELILLKDFCQNELHDKSIQELIRPFLEENVAQADLDDLLAMKSGDDDPLNKKIMPYLIEKIEEASLEDLMEVRSKDRSLNEFVEPTLKTRIEEADLSELLEALQWTTRRDREEIMSKFENHVIKLMNSMPLDELILLKSKTVYSNKLFDKLFKFVLKRNPSVVIDLFAKSSSFTNAAFNVGLLAQISDILTAEQWENVFTAFCENNQVYNSFYCPGAFCSLFQESVERSGSVQPYWLSFRKKLDKFGSDEHIDKLKHAIDSHSKAE